MTDHNPVKDALDVLHRDRAAWQLRAELDPSALRSVVEGIATQIGVSHEVALRVVENELEVRPLPAASGGRSQAATRRDIPCIEAPAGFRRAPARWARSPISTRPWSVDQSSE